MSGRLGSLASFFPLKGLTDHPPGLCLFWHLGWTEVEICTNYPSIPPVCVHFSWSYLWSAQDPLHTETDWESGWMTQQEG